MNNVAYTPAPAGMSPGAAPQAHAHQHQQAHQQQHQHHPQAPAPPPGGHHGGPPMHQQQQQIVPAFASSNPNMAFPQQTMQFNQAPPATTNIPQQSPNMAPAPPPAAAPVTTTAAAPVAANSNTTQQQQQQQQRSIHSLPCTRCGYPNCDVQILGCHCLLHVRCTPVPIRACPNPRCFNSNPATLQQQQQQQQQQAGGGAKQGCPLELLPMEFTELDEARRVADLAAKASWRAKEKSRARKKAKLDNNGGASSSGGVNSSSASCSSLDSKDVSMDLNPSSTTPPPPPPTNTSSDLRTGRWTSEETTYCDKLIQKFMAGRLPLPEGIKLNEFLSNMLKSKQSRLTKKMKNAKLSSKSFKRISGYLTDVMEAREFSECEDGFFHSIQNGLERSEIKFHMQKEWRETFSTYCVSHGQPLNVDRWLASIEEMERRVHRAKDVERMQRRKMMMGHALRQDLQNPNRGVVIEKSGSAGVSAGGGASGQQPGGSGGGGGQYQNGHGGGTFAVPDPMISSSISGNDMMKSSSATSLSEVGGTPSSQSMVSPFLHKIMAYIHRHHVPFEYFDAWVPSFVPDSDGADPAPSENGSVAGGEAGKEGEKQPKCRLCFAGSMVAKQVIVGDATSRRAVPLSSDDQFNLSAFGDYSESFSFDVGCGLPGRVYHMGVPTWEQSVHNAPLHHFERVGGSQQWGIRTVVGIPVPSPNVGRVVVVLYSRHDRTKDHDLVIRLTDEFSRLMPSPKWKLVVDVGHQQQQQMQQVVVQAPTQQAATNVGQQQQSMQQVQQQQQQQQQQSMDAQQQNNGAPSDPAALTSEVISIFGEHMPSDPSNPAFAYLQGFMSLRLLLLRSSRTEQEQDVVNTILITRLAGGQDQTSH
ncbi:hypothetical protein ACHAXR_007945 [Thalassiosira sp. AJA248-18]